jgi:hypothetical protein
MQATTTSEQSCEGVETTAAQPAGSDAAGDFFSQMSNSMAASTRIVDAGACQGKNVVRIMSSA